MSNRGPAQLSEPELLEAELEGERQHVLHVSWYSVLGGLAFPQGSQLLQIAAALHLPPKCSRRILVRAEVAMNNPTPVVSSPFEESLSLPASSLVAPTGAV